MPLRQAERQPAAVALVPAPLPTQRSRPAAVPGPVAGRRPRTTEVPTIGSTTTQPGRRRPSCRSPARHCHPRHGHGSRGGESRYTPLRDVLEMVRGQAATSGHQLAAALVGELLGVELHRQAEAFGGVEHRRGQRSYAALNRGRRGGSQDLSPEPASVQSPSGFGSQ